MEITSLTFFAGSTYVLGVMAEDGYEHTVIVEFDVNPEGRSMSFSATPLDLNKLVPLLEEYIEKEKTFAED